jgi:hypothetical protein
VPPATADGGLLVNNDLNINGAGDFHEFDPTFSQPITSVSSDYQIFPDLTGSALNPPRHGVPGERYLVCALFQRLVQRPLACILSTVE